MFQEGQGSLQSVERRPPHLTIDFEGNIWRFNIFNVTLEASIV